MKLPLFYFFAISRGNSTFVMSDPITIADNGLVFELSEFDLRKANKSFKISDYLKEWHTIRGNFFGLAKSENKLTGFLGLGGLVIPYDTRKDVSFFFLDKHKSILIKLNKQMSLEALKRRVHFLLKPLGILLERGLTLEFDEYHSNIIKQGKDYNISIGQFFSVFVCIKPKNYNKLKAAFKKAYPKQHR